MDRKFKTSHNLFQYLSPNKLKMSAELTDQETIEAQEAEISSLKAQLAELKAKKTRTHSVEQCIERTYREFLYEVREHETNDNSDQSLGCWVRGLGLSKPRPRPNNNSRKRKKK
ncbi:uncharacterized protein [Clytia hemisphaerica]|uniref:uncharacterized protein n=1 Tax=Clytia hemisphaerica TaxID=252671 RepID=UPI0034D7A1A0